MRKKNALALIALLATTALASPSCAQATAPLPSRCQFDENGVDLDHGQLLLQLRRSIDRHWRRAALVLVRRHFWSAAMNGNQLTVFDAALHRRRRRQQ